MWVCKLIFDVHPFSSVDLENVNFGVIEAMYLEKNFDMDKKVLLEKADGFKLLEIEYSGLGKRE